MTTLTLPCDICSEGCERPPGVCPSCCGHGWIQAPNLVLRGNPEAKIRIYATDGTWPRSVHGAVQIPGAANNRWEAVEWTPAGRWDPDANPVDSFWDLVTP